MKNMTLKKMFLLYSLIFIGVILVLCTALYVTFMTGVRNHVYSFADSEEKQVEVLQQRIETEQHFDPNWVSPSITYVALNNNNEILSSNGSASDRKLALSYLKGEDIPFSEGYFAKSLYPGGVCVFKYQIGVRYSSEWANQHLPRVEIIFVSAFIFSVLVSTIVFVRFISKRLENNISPLRHTVRLIGSGNLNYPVPHLSIKEFEELGSLTDHMRSDLKNTLQALWSNENQMRESTAQMLHDYRTPLTVARAHAEFLREDLSNLSDMRNKDDLIDSADALILNLERLTEIGDRLQQQMTSDTSLAGGNTVIALDDFNLSIDILGNILSDHYGNAWRSNFQKSQQTLSIDEIGLKQTLMNVLINAFEHGNSPQTVQLQFEVLQDRVQYLISNSGSCFSERALVNGTQKNFSEKANNDKALTGLGLYFARRFLDKYDGMIRLFNSPKNHACVQITLPLQAVKDDPQSPPLT